MCWFPMLVFIIYVNCLQDFSMSEFCIFMNILTCFTQNNLLYDSASTTQCTTYRAPTIKNNLKNVLYIIIDCINADDDPTGTESCRVFNF